LPVISHVRSIYCTHYASMNRSESRRVVKENIGRRWRTFWLTCEAERQASGEDSAEQSERREDAESSLCFESGNARENIPVETSSDEKYLYVWRADAPKNMGAGE